MVLSPFAHRVISRKGTANPNYPYLLHLGIQVRSLPFVRLFLFAVSVWYRVPLVVVQCYDAKFLGTYCGMASTPLQIEEDLEQLKVLENGYRMKVR